MVVDNHTLIPCPNGGLAVNVSGPLFIPRPITSTLGSPGSLEDGGYKYETTRILSAKNVKGIALTKQSVLEGIILSQIQDKSKANAAAKVAGRLSGS